MKTEHAHGFKSVPSDAVQLEWILKFSVLIFQHGIFISIDSFIFGPGSKETIAFDVDAKNISRRLIEVKDVRLDCSIRWKWAIFFFQVDFFVEITFQRKHHKPPWCRSSSNRAVAAKHLNFNWIPKIAHPLRPVAPPITLKPPYFPFSFFFLFNFPFIFLFLISFVVLRYPHQSSHFCLWFFRAEPRENQWHSIVIQTQNLILPGNNRKGGKKIALFK